MVQFIPPTEQTQWWPEASPSPPYLPRLEEHVLVHKTKVSTQLGDGAGEHPLFLRLLACVAVGYAVLLVAIVAKLLGVAAGLKAPGGAKALGVGGLDHALLDWSILGLLWGASQHQLLTGCRGVLTQEGWLQLRGGLGSLLPRWRCLASAKLCHCVLPVSSSNSKAL
ncbi:hypothetical protein E2C01_020404 [Portunus trituberculatus]|uniref:Uncharacterized protein n=1 Tax=Portunus trituberculatus TaxID=210409 RepID=A0A5B7E0E2_PORTR|nr:hypothetical protein [Portunus trituberculatus]